MAYDFPQVIFLVFTNGMLLTDEMAKRFQEQRNIVPVLSIEGYRAQTDERRGSGVYERLQTVTGRLRKTGVFFGTSITVTRQNFDEVVAGEFVQHLTAGGCRFILFSEYTPTQPGTNEWTITPEQREVLAREVKRFRAGGRALFFSAPGDESEYGGCLSAGRGFVHINANGDVEPCPFMPYSDVNVKDSSLKDALGSRFLRAIRSTQAEETAGGCALWQKRDWVRSMLDGHRESAAACASGGPTARSCGISGAREM